MMGSAVKLTFVVAATLALAGCKDAASEQQAKDVETTYTQRCLPCHGAQGRGDGPLAAGYPVKPRDWSHLPPIDPQRARRAIVEGGIGIGESPVMPPSPDLEGKRELVEGLVTKVRAMAEAKPK
jgi:hypothetical protein